MPLDDLPLRPDSAEPPSALPPARASASRPSRWVISISVAVIAIALLAMWWLGRSALEPASPAFTTATEGSVTSPRPKSQGMDLPRVDQSDELLRRLVSALSTHPLISRLLVTPAIARSATLAIVQIGDGRTPASPLAALRPNEHVTITTTPSGPIDPRSYRRWDAATAALVSLSPSDLAQLYVNVKPLFDQAYGDLGHANSDFDPAIVRAIEMLNDTPIPAAPPVLVVKPGYFEHDDAALRSLLPVQRQFLLVGPDNQRMIRGWLKRLASSLDLKIR